MPSFFLIQDVFYSDCPFQREQALGQLAETWLRTIARQASL